MSLDLIYGTPGESAEDWRASLDLAVALAPGPRVRLRARRRGGDPDGGAGAARGARAARRRRPRRQVRGRRRGAGRGRARLVRGEQLGAHARARLPAQPRLLARRRLVGRRPRGAQPRRRRPLVERAAPVGVGRARSTPGCSPAQGREVLGPAERAAEDVLLRSRLVEGLPAGRRCPSSSAARSPGSWPTASWTTEPPAPAGWSRRCADGSSRTWSPAASPGRAGPRPGRASLHQAEGEGVAVVLVLEGREARDDAEDDLDDPHHEGQEEQQPEATPR